MRIEWTLLLTGVLALCWCVRVAIDTTTAQREGREALERAAASFETPGAASSAAPRGGSSPNVQVELPPSLPIDAPEIARDEAAASPSEPGSSVGPLPASERAPNAALAQRSAPSPRRIPKGAPLAELIMPRLGLSAVVLHGSDARTLQLGLGHIESTAFPGESGNVAIAGHRDSFFRPLRRVRVGDDVMLETRAERIHYRVSSVRVVDSHEISVLRPTRQPSLTLVTCYPFSFLGHAPDRFIVRATRVEGSR